MDAEDQVANESVGRQETYEEKLDRNWNELLQEMRVMQTGVQIITAFLMTLPFQSGFDDLDARQKANYVVLLALSVLLTGLITTPVAIHRRLFGRHVKAATVSHGHRIVRIAIVGVGLIVSACVVFIIDVVYGVHPMAWIGVGVTVAVVFLLVVLPLLVRPEQLPPQRQ